MHSFLLAARQLLPPALFLWQTELGHSVSNFLKPAMLPWTDGQRDRQTDRHAGRQTGRQAGLDHVCIVELKEPESPAVHRQHQPHSILQKCEGCLFAAVQIQGGACRHSGRSSEQTGGLLCLLFLFSLSGGFLLGSEKTLLLIRKVVERL